MGIPKGLSGGLAGTGRAKCLPGKVQRFNKLLLDLAARLISSAPDEIVREIDAALKLTGEFWDFDFIALKELPGDGTDAHLIHSYTSPKVTQNLAVFTARGFPWIDEMVSRGHTIAMSRLPDDLPESAAIDRETCRMVEMRSGVALPFRIGESVRGSLALAALGAERLWSEELLGLLHYLVEILASALERKNSAARIDELREFERLLSEISAKYINLPIEDTENVTRSDFGRLARLLGVDRCSLHLIEEEKMGWRGSGGPEWYRRFAWWPEEDSDSIKRLQEMTADDPNRFDKEHYRQDMFDTLSRGEVWQFSDVDNLAGETGTTKDFFSSVLGVKSVLSVPILVGGSPVGALTVATVRARRTWANEVVARLRLFGEVFANALVRKRSEESLRNALSEVRHLKERAEADYAYLREEINVEHDFREIVGNSNILRQILTKVRQVAPTDATVLVLGETGTGKGLIARAIHNASKRKRRPLVQVNCAALAPTLIESELFGHEKGSFTGAHQRKIGRFELAQGTTLFLDEIVELSLDLQAKLLRVLQDGEFERVGGTATIKTDARVITATNKDLQKEVEAGRFRRDLWYRLNVFPIYVPPLRERLEDIPLFVNFFVTKYSKRTGKRFDVIPRKAIKALENYSWPGNIRELENVIERAAITSPEGNLRIELPTGPDLSGNRGKTLADFERDHILRVLEETYWKINGPNGAAQYLGLHPETLRTRMRKLDIRRPAPRSS
jgi:formate hydrogenlyase transcriptional activator